MIFAGQLVFITSIRLTVRLLKTKTLYAIEIMKVDYSHKVKKNESLNSKGEMVELFMFPTYAVLVKHGAYKLYKIKESDTIIRILM